MKEEWRQHPEFPDHEISTLGRVRRYLIPRHTSNGYLMVSMGVAGKRKYLHALVLEAFVGQRPIGQHGRHRNGDPRNNALDNLVYGTPKENGADAVAHGRTQRGSKHALAKLTDSQARELKRRALAGEARAALAREFGVSYTNVKLIASGKRWGHLAKYRKEG